jgi:hypothetical protein
MSLLEEHIMKRRTPLNAILFCSLVLLLALAVQVSAQPPRGRGLYGDWQVKVEFNGRQMEWILSFSRGREGNLTGQSISFMGLRDLQDVKFEEGKLSYTSSRRNRDGQTVTSKFTGTIEEGKLSGTLSSDRGDSRVEGERSPRMPRAVGNWEMKYTVGERDVTSTLVVRVDKEGKLTGQWQSPWGEHEITDIAYERGNLSFKRTSRFQDRQWESTFAGTIERDTLTGTFKSAQREIAAQGTRAGAALIGTWNLDITSDRGTRKQRLRVNGDMSGLFGAVPVKKINFEDGGVDFLMVLEFGDQTYEMTFDGKLEEAKLVGELKTSRGTQKITGTKVVRSPRGRRPS